MPDITVTIDAGNGQNAQIKLTLSDQGYKFLEALARRRGKSLEDTLIEALRVEQLLADRQLLVKEQGEVRELVSA